MSKKTNSFVETMSRLFPILFPIAIILFFVAVFSLLSFFTAMTPEEALSKGYPPMPANWSGGVFSHGSYYRWLTIAEQPLLFGFLVFLLFAAWLLLIMTSLCKRKTFMANRKSFW